MMDKLMKKAGKKPMLSDKEKQAKMSVMEDLKNMANESLSGKLKSLKKVSVMAPDQPSLEAGLDKAKELVGGAGDESMGTEQEDTNSQHEQDLRDESESEEDSEDDDSDMYSHMSKEELEAHKAMLEKCLAEKSN